MEGFSCNQSWLSLSLLLSIDFGLGTPLCLLLTFALSLHLLLSY